MTKPEQVLTVGRENAQSVTGLSWEQCLRFARAHGVSVFKLSHKSLVIPAKPLFAAMERVWAEGAAPSTFADELAAAKAEVARELRHLG